MLIKLCLMHPNKQAANAIMLIADVYTCSTRIREKGGTPLHNSDFQKYMYIIYVVLLSFFYECLDIQYPY